jgi:phage repressor protein C with HTH and peptisase S24 domain
VDNYIGQVIVEINGDSMEPHYPTGTMVRCRSVNHGDWEYINSGVYVVVYSNFFVVKRVKNGPFEGRLTLHSDNTKTGGQIEIPLKQVRQIWRVLRIVDSPAR